MDGFMRVPGGRYPCRGVQLARNLQNPPTMVMRQTVRNELRTVRVLVLICTLGKDRVNRTVPAAVIQLKFFLCRCQSCFCIDK